MLEVQTDRGFTAHVPRALYADPEVFRLEQEHLFSKSWFVFGHVSQIDHPGRFMTGVVAGQPIVVTRNRQEGLRGFRNVCSHRGAMVASGRVGDCGGAFQCIYHGWTYDLDGNLRHVPEEDALPPTFDRATKGLPPIRVDNFAGLVFVSLNPEVEPLVEFLGDAAPAVEGALAGLEVIGRVRYRLDANWKFFRENAADSYHAPYAHRHVAMLLRPGAIPETTTRAFENGHSEVAFQLSFESFDPERFMAGVEKITGIDSAGEEFFEAFKFPPEPFDAEKPNRVIGVTPNLHVLNNFGGSQAALELAFPVAHNRTIIEDLALGRPGESDEMRQYRLAESLADSGNSGRAGVDDTEAWQRCQEGAAAYPDAPFSDISRGQAEGFESRSDDVGIRTFFDYYLEQMGASISPYLEGAP